MREPTYRQAFVQAWHAVWHNKILWIFGLLSIFLGQFGFSSFIGQFGTLATSGLNQGIQTLFPQYLITLPTGLWGVLGIVLVFLIMAALFVFVAFLAVTSQGALIYFASEWFKGNKVITIAKAWKKGLQNFWEILAISIVRQVLLLFFIILLGVIFNYFFSSNTFVSGLLIALVIFAVLFIALFISMIAIYAACYAVVDGKGFFSAIKKSWNLFHRHMLVSLEAGVLLMLMNFILVALVFITSFLAFLPSILIWLVAGITNYTALIAAGFFVGIGLWFVLLAALGAFFNAYTVSAWVYLFQKMHKEGIVSRLIGWVRR
ncbi:MAG: hypothetical protein WC526_04240 [Patescibacteria group bacterium]